MVTFTRPNVNAPTPNVHADRLSALRGRFLKRFGHPADVALLDELFAEVLALADRLDYAEAKLHHITDDVASLLNRAAVEVPR